MAGEKSYYVDSFGAIKLSAYRLGWSPFAHRYVTDQTVFALYCDRLYPLKHSEDEDPVPSYWKLRNGVLLYDVPEMPLEIVGPDAVRLLEKILVCRVETLGIGPMPLCTGLQRERDHGDGWRDHAVGAERYWYVKANGEFTTWLRANAIGWILRSPIRVRKCFRFRARSRSTC